MWLQKVKHEYSQLSREHRLFILCAMLCGFCITADYAIVRPVSSSIFLTAHGSRYFPLAWLAIVPFNLLVVELYNRFLPRLGILKMVITIVTTIVVINGACAALMTKLSFLPFFFYVWKEIYVVLLFQQLWSIIHSTLSTKQAKYVYGLIFAVGGVGGICGSGLPSFFAVKMGSPNLLYASLPLLAMLIAAFWNLHRFSSVAYEETKEYVVNNFFKGIEVIRNSQYLIFILSIVILMQVTGALVYYQFNAALEATMTELDLRTEYCGKIFGIVNIATLLFQMMGPLLFLHFLGLRRSHLLLPLILFCNAIGAIIFPTFEMISVAFIVIKAFDFSIFAVLKEMLYIPLKHEEKFQAKAIIDVFAYRSSKAIASCFLLLLQLVGWVQVTYIVGWTIVIILVLWAIFVYKMFQLKEETDPN